MNREKSLDILLLLSALESWSFSTGSRLPDYLHERLADIVKELSDEILKE